MNGPTGGPDDVVVRDGDKLLVPKKTQEITILGEVQSPTSHVFQAGLTRDDYIAKSGGTTQKGGSQAHLRRARERRCRRRRPHGLVQALAQTSRCVRATPSSCRSTPSGSGPLPLWQAVTTIIYNLAVALLAVRSV